MSMRVLRRRGPGLEPTPPPPGIIWPETSPYALYNPPFFPLQAFPVRVDGGSPDFNVAARYFGGGFYGFGLHALTAGMYQVQGDITALWSTPFNSYLALEIVDTTAPPDPPSPFGTGDAYVVTPTSDADATINALAATLPDIMTITGNGTFTIDHTFSIMAGQALFYWIWLDVGVVDTEDVEIDGSGTITRLS